MKELTRSELEELLQTHDPQVLLELYEDCLDQAAIDFLTAEQEQHLAATNQILAWSETFQKSLPAVPVKPWSETPTHSRKWRGRFRRGWLLIAAGLLLSLLPIALWHHTAQESTSVLRSADLTTSVTEKRNHLTAAWLAMAEALIQVNQQPKTRGKAIALTMAAHYVALAIAADPKQQTTHVVEPFLPQFAEIFPERDLFQKIVPFSYEAKPPEFAKFQGQEPSEGIDWHQPLLKMPTEKLHHLYLELADLLSLQAKAQKDPQRAQVAYQWAATYLEMARVLNVSQAEVLIRLIRIKELLGEEAQANVLADLLNQLLE